MSFWEVLVLVLSAAGVFASILGAFLTYAARKNGEATRALIKDTHADTRTLIKDTHAETQALIGNMQAEARALIQSMEERMSRVLDRMDQRADERHREVVELIKALRAA
ncbi:MAG: hypothetical protein HYY76_02690 [Acidobacteria bacterium]|nr:hypothetical protein [Acidobacteriota bacterium]